MIVVDVEMIVVFLQTLVSGPQQPIIKKRKQDEAFDAVTSELEEVPHFLHVAEWSMSRCTQILQYHIIIQLLQYHIIIQLDGCSTDRQKKAFRIP
jgi:hypothetical protein